MLNRTRALLLMLFVLNSIHTGWAVNDGMWMGYRYTVSVTFIEDGWGGIDPPKPCSLRMPSYPIGLMKSQVSGDAIIAFTVGSDGTVREITIESAQIAEFGVAAKSAVAEWGFIPGLERRTSRVTNTRLRCKLEFRVSDIPISKDRPEGDMPPRKEQAAEIDPATTKP